MKTLLNNTTKEQKIYIIANYWLFYKKMMLYKGAISDEPSKQILKLVNQIDSREEICEYLKTDAPRVHILNHLLEYSDLFSLIEFDKSYAEDDLREIDDTTELVAIYSFCKEMNIERVNDEITYKYVKAYVTEMYDVNEFERVEIQVDNLVKEFCDFVEFMSKQQFIKKSKVIDEIRTRMTFKENKFEELCLAREQLIEKTNSKEKKKTELENELEELKTELENELENLEFKSREEYLKPFNDYGAR